MAFIDIKNPKERDKIIADYVATIHRVQQRNEDEKSANLTRQVELEKTFKPIIKATEKSTAAITQELERVNQNRPRQIQRKRTWTERTVIDFYLNSDKTKLDKYYGIQRDQDGKLWMGNVELTVDEDSNIILNGVSYKSTPGLWELIMLATPNSYTEQDLETYTKLVSKADVMNNPRNVAEGGRPLQTKKRKILEELTTGEGQSSGSGIFLPGDIKGLTAKLSLLLAEFRAGNTSTRNEIISIIDELSRRRRISRKEYNEINTYLANSL